MQNTLEGQRIPSVTLRFREGGQWVDRDTQELFAGRKVVVFSLPGAFTPTCSASHVPRYEELYDRFVDQGVHDILCVSVNDAFVMDAWKKEQGVERIGFVPDGNGLFTEAMGMLVDKAELGFGKRSWRYAMVVDDGVITRMFVEPRVPGDPYQVSDADTVLRWLGGTPPHDVLLFTRPGCSHCVRAKGRLDDAGLSWSELPTSPRILNALPGPGTTPQVFVDGQHIGGADELERWLDSRESALEFSPGTVTSQAAVAERPSA